MIKRLFVTAAACTAAALSLPAIASSEPHLGEIATFGFDFCPRGWAETNGAVLKISDHVALFSLLGTRYGGDGRTTFALPKISSPDVKHCIAMEGIFPACG